MTMTSRWGGRTSWLEDRVTPARSSSCVILIILVMVLGSSRHPTGFDVPPQRSAHKSPMVRPFPSPPPAPRGFLPARGGLTSVRVDIRRLQPRRCRL